VKAAFVSFALFVVMLLAILIGAGSDSGWVWIPVLLLGALSLGFALVAVGGALMGKGIDTDRRLLILLIALPVLIAFVGTIVVILKALGDAFQ
jgi:hypothetical protein